MNDERCAHERKTRVWSEFAGDLMERGARRLREQCADCGKLLPVFLKHSIATPATPDVDLEGAREALRKEQEFWRQRWDSRLRQANEEREQENQRWWDRYNAYLQTDEWLDLRARVLGRARNICEGCHERQATAVHHLSYEHVTEEFLWELVAICETCHRRIHDFPLDGVPRASSV
jgi:hypothetical protein